MVVTSKREVKIGRPIAYHMVKDTIGWIVRTETADRHRYWKVGAADAAQAAAIACETARADTAQAITRIRSHYSPAPAYALRPGAAIEVVWESKPVADLSEASEFEAWVGAGKKVLGEITFDIVVPEEGVTHVEGCYRLNGGNWQVYYLTNQQNGNSSLDDPIINSKAIFRSGIAGVSGVVPAGWILNKKTINEILAEAIGVDGWIEVTGPDSLILK